MMRNRYKREAETVHELKLGWLKPLHEAIPELAAMSDEKSWPPPSKVMSMQCTRRDSNSQAFRRRNLNRG
jgi:hypothetical protein